MANTRFNTKPIGSNTWLIQGEGSNSYLVGGAAQAILIDTGYATENIQLYAQSLIETPLKMAANTHGHFDHTGGNGWFEQVFMSEKALETARIPYPSKNAAAYPLEYPVVTVREGDKIDLGQRELEVIEIPAHAPGSIAYLDRTGRILYTGDEVEKAVMLIWMQDEPQPSVEQHAQNMEKLLQYRAEVDYICSGHNLVMASPSLIETYLEHDRRIMLGVEGGPWIQLEDAPADFYLPQPEYKRTSKFEGTTIGYDCRFVFNNLPKR